MIKRKFKAKKFKFYKSFMRHKLIDMYTMYMYSFNIKRSHYPDKSYREYVEFITKTGLEA